MQFIELADTSYVIDKDKQRSILGGSTVLEVVFLNDN